MNIAKKFACGSKKGTQTIALCYIADRVMVNKKTKHICDGMQTLSPV